MSNNCHIQHASCMLIAAPLNAACELYEGGLVYVTAGFTTLNATEEVVEGTDYSADNAGGVQCGPEVRGEDRVKWLNIEGELCATDWAFMGALSGKTVVLDADGNVVGFDEIDTSGTGVCATSGDPKPRYALAIIRAAATGDGGCVTDSDDTGATGMVATVFPNTTNWKFTKSAFENARQTWTMTGRAYKSPNPMRGPLNLRPSGVSPQAIPATALSSSFFINPASLPEPTCGTIPHPVPTADADEEEG